MKQESIARMLEALIGNLNPAPKNALILSRTHQCSRGFDRPLVIMLIPKWIQEHAQFHCSHLEMDRPASIHLPNGSRIQFASSQQELQEFLGYEVDWAILDGSQSPDLTKIVRQRVLARGGILEIDPL